MGNLSRNCPIQSKILCQAIDPNFERQRLIDQDIINLCLPLANTSSIQDFPSLSLNSEEIALGVIQNLPPPRFMDSVHPKNIFELLEVSNDLKIGLSLEKSEGDLHDRAKGETQREPQSFPQERNDPPRNLTTESKENGKQPREIKANTENTNKRNPFKSAKEQFGEEVLY